MKPNDQHLYRKLLAEFIGTFYLVMMIVLAKGYNEAVPAIVVSSVASTGIISGAYFNPALALGSLLKDTYQTGLHWPTVRLYLFVMALECVAGILGGFYAFLISGQTLKLTKNVLTSVAGSFLAEAFGTMNLVSMGLMVAHFRTHILVAVCCLAGSVLATIQWDVSGAVLNPAVGLGVKLADAANHGSSRLDNLWVYLIAPLLGGVLAVFLNQLYLAEVRSQAEDLNKTKLIPLESDTD